jgi:uncharacterized protein
MHEAQPHSAPALRLGLVAAAVGAAFAIPWIASLASAPLGGHALAHAVVHHAVQAALSLAVIGAFALRDSAVDCGLRLPRRRQDVGRAAAWSLLVAALFTLVRYVPNVVAGQAPEPDYPMSIGSFTGWVFFQGLYVGPTEEILFRSLVIGVLTRAALPRLPIHRTSLSGATLLAAVIFAGAHYQAIGVAPWYVATFQMTYAVVLGVIYGHWFEKTRSVLVPALAHNATDLFATLVAFGLGAFWR